MLYTDCNREGAEQVTPLLHRSGYNGVHLAHSPGPLYGYHEEVPGWMHSDMWIVPLDAKLALIYPPWCDYETIRRLDAIGYELIECPGGNRSLPDERDNDRTAAGDHERDSAKNQAAPGKAQGRSDHG
jgi:hypothetical protein